MNSIFKIHQTLSIGILMCICPLSYATTYNFDLEIPFFTDASMICDHPSLNITKANDIGQISWLFPDGEAVYADSLLNPNKFIFSGPDSSLSLSSQAEKYAAYNLTALNVDDTMFGYYTCIVVYTDDAKALSVIRWGLNVDGADFSELIDQYKKNAIIGGIAAAVLLALIGGACIFYYYRYGDQHSLEKIEVDGNDLMDKKVQQGRDNTGFSEDLDPENVKVHVDNGRADTKM